MNVLFDRVPIRLRLSIGHGVVMAFMFSAIGYGVYRILERNLLESVDGALYATAQSILDSRQSFGFDSHIFEQFIGDLFGEQQISVTSQIVDLSGRIQTDRSHTPLPVSPLALQRAQKGFYTFETFKFTKDHPYRIITAPVIFQGRFTGELVQVGCDLKGIYATMREMTTVLWISLSLGLGLTVIFGYLLTKRSLKPVTEIRAAAAKLGADDLSVRLTLPGARDELRDLAETFNQMLDRMEDSFKRLQRFSSDVSHELRSPVAVMMGEAELSLRKTRNPEEYQQSLQTIAKESKKMATIIQDLLLLARTNAPLFQPEWVKVNMEDFIGDVTRDLAHDIKERQIDLQVNLKYGESFYCAPSYLAIALKNLLFNGIKHSSSGAKMIFTVEKKSPQQLVFVVQDFGDGIPPEALPYIFDSFYRVDSARNRTSGGVGIGLSLVMAMVRLHRGTVQVESKIKEGSTFTIRLPMDLSRSS